MWSLATIGLICVSLACGFIPDEVHRNYTEFQRTMIINQREIIMRLLIIEPTIKSCREHQGEPYNEADIDIYDKEAGRLPDFQHHMIHYQRTIMSQLNRVIDDAKDCRRNEPLFLLGQTESTVPFPNATAINCEDGQVKFGLKCLRFVATPLSWEQAEIACRNTGGTLAETRIADAFIKVVTDYRMEDTALSRSIWIGANGLAYKRAPRDPNVKVYGINCPTVHYFPGGGDKLSDFPCKYRRSFVCEQPSIH